MECRRFLNVRERKIAADLGRKILELGAMSSEGVQNRAAVKGARMNSIVDQCDI